MCMYIYIYVYIYIYILYTLPSLVLLITSPPLEHLFQRRIRRADLTDLGEAVPDVGRTVLGRGPTRTTGPKDLGESHGGYGEAWRSSGC